ncbi:antitoxin Xre-like helix-turn-helix domain-containing protein [Pseudomonas mandelii]|uniref:antitoxin Xre-like helix-turn-helix domain-containing protein n=1 Tax=Pseudomonas mandelii TaxID=75612 RepID=UPI003D2F5B25
MIGLPARGAELHKKVHQGLPFAFYQRLADILDVPVSELRKSLWIAPATLSRRAAAGRLNTTFV